MSFFSPAAIVQRTRDTKTRNIRSPVKIKLNSHPTHPRGGHPSHSDLVRGKLTSPTPDHGHVFVFFSKRTFLLMIKIS